MKESDKGTTAGAVQVSGFRGANYWARQVGRAELPILRSTVMAIARVFSQTGTSSAAMAEAVAKDPFMSARILRMANSAFYNPGLKKVIAIPRAVVVVGFDAVRQACLFARFVEETYSDQRLYEIVRCALRAYRQALMAQWIGETLRDGSPEELYAAGLLLDIGLLSLLCVVPLETVLAFREKRSRCAATEQPAMEKEVFGFETRRLTVRLAEEWTLGDLVKKAALHREETDARIQCVRAASALSLAFEQGRESEAWTAALEAAVDRLKVPEATVLRLLEAAERKAREFSQELPMTEEALLTAKEPTAAAKEKDVMATRLVEIREQEPPMLREDLWGPADAERQLELLDDLLAYLVDEARGHSQGVLDRAARGLLEGAGLDRLGYFRLTPDERFLELKNLYGPLDARFQGLLVPVEPYPNLLAHVLRGPAWLWVHEKSPPSIKGLITPEVLQFFPARELFVGRVGWAHQPAGVFAGDRLPGNRPLDERAFLAFRRFCHLATLGLALLRRTAP
ncbi:HDOD domain-containing protein [Desulfosoma caldarium]|uniref:HD-like signal output (HDOD) protein n=1 Tax=Desulfosoma caldarium TaxID=610254 RepID=A0A3N1UVF6_9BACT|nr:HDOD domain-containing protein [Desulfosoma caldarium]ROQ93409.1 HD-like signal output (HDOD) protein [Desulfosoma caldarium]